MSDYNNSDALLEESNKIERDRISAGVRANDQRHERFLRTLTRVTRMISIVGGIAVASIFGGPYALQGCQHVSDNWEISSARRAVEAKEEAAAQVIADAAQAAADEEAARRLDAPRQARIAAQENCVKTLGTVACMEVENGILLQVWDSHATWDQIGRNVKKVLVDRGVIPN